MSRLIKKVIPTEKDRDIRLVKHNCRIYQKRMGRIKFIIVFLLMPRIHNSKQGFFITDKEVNGVPDGYYNSVFESKISGTLINVEEVPDNIIKLAAGELRNERRN